MSDLHLKQQLHTTTRYRQLDSLRGLAALAVFFAHCSGIYSNVPYLGSLSCTPIGILYNGQAAVIFFFTLSGFVISLPFVNNAVPLKFTEFYIKRIFRIYPAYIVTLTLALILKYFLFDKASLTHYSSWLNLFWNWNWTAENMKEIIKSYILIGPSFNPDLIDPATWSLVIEMRLSLLLPFLIIIVSKTNLRITLGIAIIILLYSCYSGKAEYVSIFFSGVILAKYHKHLITHVQKIPFWAFFLLCLISILLYNSNFEYYKITPETAYHLKYFLRHYTMAIGCCLIIILTISKSNLSAFLEKKPFKFLGDTSYGFYLLHMPVLFTVASIVSYHSAISIVYLIFLSVFISFSLSILMYNWIEIPFQKLAKTIIKHYHSFFKY